MLLRHPLLLAAALAALLAAPAARADLQDEIQVYDDAINAPGETGLELHVNTTPVGRATPDYPGEIVPRHALRITPEFSLGLTRTLEAGLYLPTVRRPDGRFESAGAKLRMKWLPLQTEDGVGTFAGINLELSRVAWRYEAERSGMELRFIAGWRNRDWLLSFNPVLGRGLSAGSPARPDLLLGLRAVRQVGEGLGLGAEFYKASGPLARSLPWSQQDQRVYGVMELERGGWGVHLGVGRGLTPASDRWTLKAILDVPLPKAG